MHSKYKCFVNMVVKDDNDRKVSPRTGHARRYGCDFKRTSWMISAEWSGVGRSENARKTMQLMQRRGRKLKLIGRVCQMRIQSVRRLGRENNNNNKWKVRSFFEGISIMQPMDFASYPGGSTKTASERATAETAENVWPLEQSICGEKSRRNPVCRVYRRTSTRPTRDREPRPR